ncbi:MAG TPA: lipocalin-like domain-containing protein, partial [Usitatibacteraceae bacterium]
NKFLCRLLALLLLPALSPALSPALPPVLQPVPAREANKESAPPMEYAVVTPGMPLVFPRDHGAHPAFRTEWWYATGHLQTASGKALGFQLTFFRSRSGIGEANQTRNGSRFAPAQILFAHAAIAYPALGRLRHDERVARAGFGVGTQTEKLDVALEGWTLRMDQQTMQAHIPARDFTLDLRLSASRPPLLQGDQGYSRKGPQPGQASYYVSLPQLAVNGSVVIDGKREDVSGTAWFDHEWSSEYLAAEATGWDWLGANLDDGGALMAFRMRGQDGSAIWAGGTRMQANGRSQALGPDEIAFTPLRTWRSPRTGASWPVAMTVRAGKESFELQPWMDDQELDSSRSTGITYWEGAVDVLQNKVRRGRGYLELTGYAQALRF